MKRTLTLTALALASVSLVAVASQKQSQAESSTQTEAIDYARDMEPLDRSGSSGYVTSYADMLEQVTPAVVSVAVERKASYRPSMRSSEDMQRRMLEDMLRRFYGQEFEDRLPERNREPDPQQQDRYRLEGTGSGFIISADGYILTNNHVVEGDSGYDQDEDSEVVRITVQLTDGREYEAEVVGTDPTTDIAVLKVEAEGLPALSLGDSSQMKVGDIVFAVGNPLRIGQTVSIGIVSAVNRTDLGIIDQGLRRRGAQGQQPAIENFIQTDAAINMGNSGGPLVDAQGRVIGINSAISSIGGGSIGIGFAVPINLAERTMQMLVGGGKLSRGFIGVELGPLDAEQARAFGLDSTKGVIVQGVTEGLPADAAGVQRGDVILSVDGERVDSVRDMVYLISTRSPGVEVVLEVFRFGETMELTVALGDRTKLLAGGGFGSGARGLR